MSSYHTKNNRTSKRGAFIKGIWHCDCDPRMPAEKFQTKNGGKNHGRWFYTCQKGQTKRCGFFLWADDAKVREEGAVLNNSRSESETLAVYAPQTPKKTTPTTTSTLLQTPVRTPTTLLQTATPISRNRLISATPGKGRFVMQDKEEEFDWPSSNDGDLASAVDTFETPRKAPRTASNTSPSKRALATFNDSDDVFTTPATSRRANGLLSPTTTPAHLRFRDANSDQSASTLATDALSLLSSTPLPPTTKTSLIDMLNRFELKTQGIAKGRDLTRLALQQKDIKIADLQSRIQGLEQERETMKNVISLLKTDIATSPKPGLRRPRTHDDRRKSEV